jgi:PiT family inorganic phosphate transporter
LSRRWAENYEAQTCGGFCAETAGAITLLGTALGDPVSTTHTITARSWAWGHQALSSVRWGVANTIVWAWVLTIPLSALIAAVSYYLISRFV